MGKYAETTSVPPDKSRSEIEKTLKRYGASAFMYGERDEQVVIAFEMRGRRFRFDLSIAPMTAFSRTASGLPRSEGAVASAWDQARRQRWRALALVIKAKLEAVEAGIVTLEDEFLAHTVLPDNSTVGQSIHSKIALAYEQGEVPALLPPPRGQR